MIAKRLIIAGRVQGVGYRDWMVVEAERLGVHGWVRNRGAGEVEALIAGDVDAVEELARHCRRGPRPAHVTSVTEEPDELPEAEGFRRAASV